FTTLTPPLTTTIFPYTTLFRSLSRLPRSLGEDEALRAARRAGCGHGADRELRHASGCERQRPVLPPSRGALLLDRPGRPRPGRGLRGAAQHRPFRGRALALAESGLHPRYPVVLSGRPRGVRSLSGCGRR